MNALNILYKELDFQSGGLFSASAAPSSFTPADWLEKGEWLAAAKRAGAEKLFFVKNNPVAVFCKCGAGIGEKVKAFNKAWCLARPRLLFLASEGEITVYDLAQRPVNESNSDDWKRLKSLAMLENLQEVATKLEMFHRDNIESGQLFGDARFGDLKNRADQALIRDLKTVRLELMNAGLSGELVRFAHALIGRSIFIRYLEDRHILTKSYFAEVANQREEWSRLLNSPKFGIGVDLTGKETFYPRVLENKEFTYALFKRLARDFNGDTFPEDADEERTVTCEHLTQIQSLLYGDAGVNRKLFFYSYQFNIVPLDLISSIYEEFYHSNVAKDEKKSKARQDGAFYTPPVLAEFVLSRVLTPDTLAQRPRVLDPACGSGIFLVEAFRRIVRHKWRETGKLPAFEDLKTILRDQIAGMEVNPEAARITAFSLYLALLHYLDPPDILHQIEMGNRLPNLVASEQRTQNHFHCILAGNAFNTSLIDSNPLWKERFGPGCADVVVGNPPWGDPGKKADEITKARQATLIKWCNDNKKPIGDNEPSQAFLWRAVDLLKPNCTAGMLVSAGVLFKHSPKAKLFRSNLFDLCSFQEVFNFSHVRKFFFKGAISPFLFIKINKSSDVKGDVRYWTAKQVKSISKTQSILFSKYDLHVLNREEVLDATIWKKLWFGNRADKEFINYLTRFSPLKTVVDRDGSGQGYKEAAKDKKANSLAKYHNLSIKKFSRYNLLEFSPPPDMVERFGVLEVYSGKRLLVQRGIDESHLEKGRIVARFESEPFCFTNALNGIKLKSQEEWGYLALLGILWSSLARYYFFMTASNWGLWHHEIHLEDELLQLPIVLLDNHPATSKLIPIIESLRAYYPQKYEGLYHDGISENKIEEQRRQWERELDEAVFDLYGLNEEQRDLIRDCCEVTLPFFYKPFDSVGAMPAVEGGKLLWIEKYARIFGRRWNAYLDEGQEMRAEVHLGAHGNMLAIEFYPADRDDPWNLKPKNDSWSQLLEQIGDRLPQQMGASEILLDGLAHIISDDAIIIIKRNEKRFWTRSIAREDADATLCKRMTDTIPDGRRLG